MSPPGWIWRENVVVKFGVRDRLTVILFRHSNQGRAQAKQPWSKERLAWCEISEGGLTAGHTWRVVELGSWGCRGWVLSQKRSDWLEGTQSPVGGELTLELAMLLHISKHLLNACCVRFGAEQWEYNEKKRESNPCPLRANTPGVVGGGGGGEGAICRGFYLYLYS